MHSGGGAGGQLSLDQRRAGPNRAQGEAHRSGQDDTAGWDQREHKDLRGREKGQPDLKPPDPSLPTRGSRFELENRLQNLQVSKEQ